MSRSYRHTPIIGNTTTKSEKRDKQLANRAWRRIVRVCISTGREVLPLQKEVSNVWGGGKDGKGWIGNRYPELMRK